MPQISFDTPAERLAYWQRHAPAGAPKEPDEAYIPYIESAAPGEMWDAFVLRRAALAAHSDRAANSLLPVYGDKYLNSSGFNEAELDKVFLAAVSIKPRLAPYLRWCRLAPAFHFLPVDHEEETADFVWSRARCFLAGAGHEAHAELSSLLSSMFPMCPFDASESKEAWEAELSKAKVACGWPVTMSLVNWHSLIRCAPSVTKDARAPAWLRMIALLHFLKHARRSESQGLVCHYNGMSTVIELERTNILGTWGIGRRSLTIAFKCAAPAGKGEAPLTSVALSSIIDSTDINDLLVKKSLADLPPNYLAGPWTAPTPAPDAFEGFYQTGLAMGQLWEAAGGEVFKSSADQDAVLDYDWNCKDYVTHLKEYQIFKASIPRTYSAAWPSDVFFDAFPNWDMQWYKETGVRAAAHVLFDLPIAASLLRSTCPELDSEFPAVVFMPMSPSPSDSTNQGKSQAALTYARAVNPATTKLMSINDSGSAPDVRSVAAEIRSTGGLAIDEFRPPKSQTHVLSHDNMQAMCTGSNVASGRVYENEGQIRFRTSPVFSAKVYDVPPDIQNRSIVHWLGDLDDTMRSRAEIISQLRSGALSVRMRLGLYAIIEERGLRAAFKAEPKTSSKAGLRYDGHRALGSLLLRARGVEEPYKALDAATASMLQHQRSHVTEALESGLIAAMEFGSALRLRVHTLFEESDAVAVREVAEYLAAMRSGRPGCLGNHPRDFLRIWAERRGLAGRPLQDILPLLTGSRRHASDRAIVVSLLSDMKDNMRALGSTWMLPGEAGLVYGWGIVRMADDLFNLVCLHPSEAAANAVAAELAK